MNTELEIYLKAVSIRKPWNKATGLMNSAIVMQLQDDDIPRLLKMLRAYQQAHEEINACGWVPPEVLELACSGNCAHWGSYEPKNTATPEVATQEGKTDVG